MVLTAVLVAPTVMAVATRVEHRLGPSAGGWVAALPLALAVAVVAVLLSSGDQAASDMTISAAAHVVAQIAFAVVLAGVLARRGWVTGVLAGVLAYVVVALGVALVPEWLAVALAVPALVVAPRLVGSPPPRATPARHWSTTVVVCGACAVLVGAALVSAQVAGPVVAGAVAAFPTTTTVLAIALSVRAGAPAARALLVGLVRALPCYLAFCLVAAVLVPAVGVLAFPPALLVCVGVGRLTWRTIPLAPRTTRTQTVRPTGGRGRSGGGSGRMAGVTGAAAEDDDLVLHLPSAGPDPLSLGVARTALRGYARGRRWVRFRSPGSPEGRWVQVPAFGWSRFDAGPLPPPGDDDVLVGEVLHGRLDRVGWTTVRDALAAVRPPAAAAVQRAGGRAFWELPDEELSVLGEPGTVGAALRAIGRASGDHLGHVLAPLHRRHPTLVPHLTRSTRRALLPHVEEGDSGVEAVIRRELRGNAAAFAALEDAVAAELGDARPTRLRLHDILLWLTTTLRLAHAVELGRRPLDDADEEWDGPRTSAARPV